MTAFADYMSSLTPHEWPKWAPAQLTAMHGVLSSVVGNGPPSPTTQYQANLLQVIRTLCTDLRMIDVWSVLDNHALRTDYHDDLAEAITVALWPPHRFQSLTPAQERAKRKKAAAEARKLKSTMRDLGFDTKTVFPVIGPKAMSGPIQYFLQDRGALLPADAPQWDRELKVLNLLMMANSPGVGSWGEVLERLAQSIEKGAYEADRTRIDGPADLMGRAKNFALNVSVTLGELCGCRLNPQVIRLTEIFFPGADVDPSAFGMLLLRQARQS